MCWGGEGGGVGWGFRGISDLSVVKWKRWMGACEMDWAELVRACFLMRLFRYRGHFDIRRMLIDLFLDQKWFQVFTSKL